MAIVTLWDNPEKNRIRIEFESEWTWDELEQAIATSDQLIASVGHMVDLIIDIEGSNLPRDFMNAAKKLLSNPQPRENEGRRVVVGASGVMRTAYQTIQKTFGDRLNGRAVLFDDDMSQARSILYSMRLEDK